MTRGFMERFGTPTEIIEETLSEMRQQNSFSMVNQMKNYMGGLVVQAVIGLLIGLIFKKTDPNAID
jgi:acid phosphatase family membrane protein YuiD